MQKQYRLLYDENLCIGCQACSVACRMENSVPDNVYRVQVHMKTLGVFPNLGMQYERRSCVMCENPPCVSVCPTNASFQSKDGLVHISMLSNSFVEDPHKVVKVKVLEVDVQRKRIALTMRLEDKPTDKPTSGRNLQENRKNSEKSDRFSGNKSQRNQFANNAFADALKGWKK